MESYAAGLYTNTVSTLQDAFGTSFATTLATFDPNFQYTVTPSQHDALTANAVWTPTQLTYAIDRAALRGGGGPTNAAVTTVTGHNVTLNATGGSIGRPAGSVVVTMADLIAGTLTDEQVGAISTAVAPGSITIHALVNGVDSHFNLATAPVDCAADPGDPSCKTISIIDFTIAENAPIFVDVAGTFTAHATGNVFVQSNGANLDIAQVTAGGAATLTAPQDISSTGALVPAVQTGGDLTLDAQSGDLRGSVSRALVIRVGGILRAAVAGNQVWLTQDTGNLTFDVISAGTTVTVGVSNGSLFQHSTGIGIPFGTNLTLTASGGIGTLAQPVTGQIDPAGTVTATAGGDLYYSEIGNDLQIGTITSTGGSVRLESDLSIVDAASSSAHTLANNSITLIADHGSLGSQTNHLNIDSRRGGVSGVVNASTSFGDAYVDETSGDLYLGTVGASGAGTETAYLQALSGSIFNGLVSGANVTAPNVWLSATGAIGAAGAGHSIETVVSNVAARAFGGGIWLDNTGPLFVGGVTDASGATQANALQATGPITVSVHSPLTIGANVLAGGNILFSTADDSSNDNIVVLPAVQITSTGGSIEFDAGDNINISPTSTISAATGVTFRGDFGNSDGLPTSILLQGDLSGTVISVFGGPANDTITLRLHSLAGHVQVFGGNGADLIWVDGLPNLDVANTCTTNPCGAPSTLNTGHNGNRQTVDLDGQGGGDTYLVQTTGNTSYIVNVHDSGAANDGVDSLVVDGTNADDTFLLRAQFVSKLDANSVVERVNYDDSVNTLQVNGYSESTGVDAPDGNDSFYVDDNSAITVLDGGTGDDTFQFGQMFGADRQPPDVAPGDEIATVDTTVGWLSRGISLLDGRLRRRRQGHVHRLLEQGDAEALRRGRRRHLRRPGVHHPRLARPLDEPGRRRATRS